MISIVIPVFNVERFLSHCIDCVLNQSRSDFELILVDDGSKDTSGIICDDYAKKDNRFRVIHIPNSGVSKARNIGIEEAKGEWITFIDSDDFVANKYLEEFNIERGDADLIIQGLEYYDSRSGKFFKQCRMRDCLLKPQNYKQLVAENSLLHCGFPIAKMYKRSLLGDEIRFNPRLSFHEDHIFVFEVMSAANSIRLVDSVSYKYRCYYSSNSLSRKKHSWENLNDSSEGMLSCLNSMKERFLEKDSSYSRSIFTFAYAPKLEAVYELYRGNKDRRQRTMDFKKIIVKKELKKYYFPNDIKNQLVKGVISYMPQFIVDLFVNLVVKYQDRKRI